MLRHDGRKKEELRLGKIEINPLLYPMGSVIVEQGDTKVLGGISLEKRTPAFLAENQQGSLKVTVGVLPFAQLTENQPLEEVTSFIQQSLSSLLNLKVPLHLHLHLEILQDAGSCLSVAFNAGFMTLYLGVRKLLQENKLTENPLQEFVAAVTCGILANDEVAVDLDAYEEVQAKTKMTLLMTEKGDFVDLLASGKKEPFSGDILNGLLFRGKNAIEEILSLEKEALLAKDYEEQSQVLVIATKNPGKAKEFTKMFAPLGFKVKTLLDYPEIKEIPETGQTFEENAKIKAEAISGILQQVVLADDSGLKVDALGGLPGIYSARFAGPHKNDASNNAKLLAEMGEIEKGKRQGQFYCALAVAAPHKETLTVNGSWSGEIATVPAGDNGFGYDVLFYVPELEKTAAELSDEEKNQYSHRSQAIKALMEKWPTWWEEEQ